MLLKVFDELVFFAEFIVVAKVIDFLMRGEFLFVEFIDELLLTPNQVPVIAFDSLPTSHLKGIEYAVGEVGFEFDSGSVSESNYMRGW